MSDEEIETSDTVRSNDAYDMWLLNYDSEEMIQEIKGIID